jgi:predicted P-loop ATPase/GTPase
MKINHYLFVLPLCAVFLFNGKTYNDAVAERIGSITSPWMATLGAW